MDIVVKFANDTFSIVQHDELDDLIASERIVAFRRSSGWVDVKLDPIRHRGPPHDYTGVERRGRGTQLLTAWP